MLGIMVLKKRIEEVGVDVQCALKLVYLQSLYLSAPRKLTGSGTDLDTGLAPGPGMSRWAPHAWASFVHCVVYSRRPAPRRKSMALARCKNGLVAGIQKARHCPATGIWVQTP